MNIKNYYFFMKDMQKVSKCLADYIRRERAELSITQEQLAEISGIDSKHIQNLESYKRVNDPKLSTLYKLSSALKKGIPEMLNCIDNTNYYERKRNGYTNYLAVSDQKRNNNEGSL